jgi:predicted nucleotidyltransferase
MAESESTGAVTGRAEQGLAEFVSTAREALGASLVSAVLFGSGAEGRLRASSDVNLIVVLRELDMARLEGLREALRLARAAIRLEVMFVVEAELDELVEAFADKFADVARRRRVLFGADPFAGRMPSRRAQLLRLRQVSLNLVVRMRQRYLLASLREEQALRAVADLSGTLRVVAADLLALAGGPVSSPKDALGHYARELGEVGWLEAVSAARDQQLLVPGEAARVLLRMLELASHLHARTSALSEAGP